MNSGLVPHNIQMSIDRPKVDLLGVYTVEKTSWNEENSPGIVFVLGAKTNIGVRLSSFDLVAKASY